MQCYVLVKVGKHAQHGYTKVSIEDYMWLVALRKTLSQVHGYAFVANFHSRGKSAKLHRLILERKLGRTLLISEQVDHINSDRLDNRRENLRIASNTENSRNKRKRHNTLSQYKGVTIHKASGLWHAQIKINKRNHGLGYFHTEEAAHEAYCKAAQEHYGEFARFS